MLEHGPGCLVNDRDEIASRFIQPLAHPFRRGDAVYTQRLTKRGVLPHAGYGLKITLAHAEQAKIAPQDIDLGEVIAPGHLPADPASQLAVSVDAGSNQGQPGMAGIEFAVALLQNESFHHRSCRVNFFDRPALQYFSNNFNMLISKPTIFY